MSQATTGPRLQKPSTRPPALAAPGTPLIQPQAVATSFATQPSPKPFVYNSSTYASGTSPYFVTELMQSRHSCCLGLFWAICFVGFILLLLYSNEMQYDCFSFCETPQTRSCGLLSSSNASDLSWTLAASNCFDPTSLEWSSGGAFSTTLFVFGEDVIPDMRSPARRHSRFILRFVLGDYDVVSDSLFSPTQGPQLRSLVRVVNGAVLLPPITLETVPIRTVFTLDFSSSSRNAAIIFELPVGYRFPVGTQQIELLFPAGPPLTPLFNQLTEPGRGPVQLTYATSTPAYIIADTVLRYVLLLSNVGVVMLIICLYALADTNIYPLVDPTIPAGEVWSLAWLRAVRCVIATEFPSRFGHIWRRLPFFVKCAVGCLSSISFLCDPLAGAFAAVPQNNFLRFWSLHLMPWWRFSWMVATSAWLLACLITCGDRGRMFTVPRAVAAITDPVRSRAAALVAGPSVWAFHASLRWSTRALLLFLCIVPSALYLLSVISSEIHGWPSEPQSVGVIPGKAMYGSLIGMQLWFPMIILGFLYFNHRLLYRRFPKGVNDTESMQIFGVPSAPNNGRPLVVAVRCLLPYCVWTSLFVAGAHFGILTGLATLLPTYYNGHMTEVLQCVLLAWTIGFMIVPVRKSLRAYPPRPCVYPPPSAAVVVGNVEDRSIVHASFALPTVSNTLPNLDTASASAVTEGSRETTLGPRHVVTSTTLRSPYGAKYSGQQSISETYAKASLPIVATRSEPRPTPLHSSSCKGPFSQ